MVEGRAASTWPTLKEYDEALLDRLRTVHDNDIQHGELAKDLTGPMRLNGGGEKYVCVYKVGNWAVRCFTGHPPSDIDERYEAISACLQRWRAELPFLIEHNWIKDGITVKGSTFPLLKVRYLSGCQPLGEFLGSYYNNREVVQVLAEKWLEMIRKLEEKHIAHGDLDVSNVLVQGKPPQPLELHLIDFDGMYVPAFDGRSYQVADLGHEHFQPFKQGIRHFNHEMDRFSALVIYLSLVALAENPALWLQCDADESNRLLLGSDDFQRPALSRNVVLLHQQRNIRLRTALRELLRSIERNSMPASMVDVLAKAPSTPRMPTFQAPEALPLPLPLTGAPPPMEISGMMPPLVNPYQSTPANPYQTVQADQRQPVPTNGGSARPLLYIAGCVLLLVIILLVFHVI